MKSRPAFQAQKIQSRVSNVSDPIARYAWNFLSEKHRFFGDTKSNGIFGFPSYCVARIRFMVYKFGPVDLWQFTRQWSGSKQSGYSRREVKLEDKGDKSTGSAYTIQEVGCSICPGQGKAGGGSDRLCWLPIILTQNMRPGVHRGRPVKKQCYINAGICWKSSKDSRIPNWRDKELNYLHEIPPA